MKHGLTLTLTSLVFFFPPMAAGQSQDSPDAEDAVPAEIAVSAQRVYLDPETGRLTNTPPPGAEAFALSQEELNMLSTSDQGLIETPLPGGGSAVDLRGRFQHMAVATVAEDGTIVIKEVAGEAFLPVASRQLNSEDEKKE